MNIRLTGGPADGAVVSIADDENCSGFAVIVDPLGNGWHFDDDDRPPSSTGTRYHYDLSGRLVEVQVIRGGAS